MEVKHTAQGLYAVNYLQVGHALDTTSPNISGCSSEGSLEVKLPTIWRDEKAVSREKRSEERRCRCAKR